MATCSIKDEVTIEDPKKSEEVLKAFMRPIDTSIKPAQPPELPKDAASIWFKNLQQF